MTTSEVAIELRRIADALDKKPELAVCPYLSITAHGDDKETFLALARLMPRPITKRVRNEGTTYEDYEVLNGFFRVSIPRGNICEIIEPAKPAVFHCPSLLSEEEEAALDAF